MLPHLGLMFVNSWDVVTGLDWRRLGERDGIGGHLYSSQLLGEESMLLSETVSGKYGCYPRPRSLEEKEE